jgi:uncharacterized OB-fold protein
MNSLNIEYSLPLPYRHYAGVIGSRFLKELRDNKKIIGTKCPECHKVYVPARSICPCCLVPIEEIVPISDKGVLVTYTRVNHKEPVQPVHGWFMYGIFKLDGADTNIVHFLNGIDPEYVKPGLPVQAVFKNERKGSILDIAYFKPIGRQLISANGWGENVEALPTSEDLNMARYKG